jgi:hypothetical protein
MLPRSPVGLHFLTRTGTNFRSVSVGPIRKAAPIRYWQISIQDTPPKVPEPDGTGDSERGAGPCLARGRAILRLPGIDLLNQSARLFPNRAQDIDPRCEAFLFQC